MRNQASAATRAAQKTAAASLPREDGADAARATRGFVATISDAVIDQVWSLAPYAFIQGDAPDTVHPGLWRQAKLNGEHGLFEVAPGIHQVRGFDLSTVTFVAGERGIIVIDRMNRPDDPQQRQAILLKCSFPERTFDRCPC